MRPRSTFQFGLILFTASVACVGQVPPAFEVAAIKASTLDSPPMGIKRTQAQFATSNTSLAFLIRWAYDLDERRLIGAKNLDSARFDILAKIPTAELLPGQLRLMMRALLAERFQLRVHKENRELSTYALAVDKAGPKLHYVDLGEGFGQNPFKMTDHGRLVDTKVTAAMLAKVLAEQLGDPVEDATGLTRPFDFVLEWAPDALLAEPGAQPSSPIMNRPSLSAALRDQLGLRLVTRRSAVEVVVVDGVSGTPVEN
ncbi:MAG: TIGR03435 family protein [Candidatus Solibacter sp.]